MPSAARLQICRTQRRNQGGAIGAAFRFGGRSLLSILTSLVVIHSRHLSIVGRHPSSAFSKRPQTKRSPDAQDAPSSRGCFAHFHRDLCSDGSFRHPGGFQTRSEDNRRFIHGRQVDFDGVFRTARVRGQSIDVQALAQIAGATGGDLRVIANWTPENPQLVSISDQSTQVTLTVRCGLLRRPRETETFWSRRSARADLSKPSSVSSCSSIGIDPEG